MSDEDSIYAQLLVTNRYFVSWVIRMFGKYEDPGSYLLGYRWTN
jgi:hypothetical protein